MSMDIGPATEYNNLVSDRFCNAGYTQKTLKILLCVVADVPIELLVAVEVFIESVIVIEFAFLESMLSAYPRPLRIDEASLDRIVESAGRLHHQKPVAIVHIYLDIPMSDDPEEIVVIIVVLRFVDLDREIHAALGRDTLITRVLVLLLGGFFLLGFIAEPVEHLLAPSSIVARPRSII
jgi:hypothetical protein